MAGRPREFDRDEALTQAMLLFWEHGYEGTSMSALVAAMGIASARIYAAFGSKQQLFEEAIHLYETHEGGFADHALEIADIAQALGQMLRDAVATYTRQEGPRGCFVVSAANSVAPENIAVQRWLSEHRRQRTQAIVLRLQAAKNANQLKKGANVQALGDFYATFLHGISIQARDGVAKDALLRAVDCAMDLLPLKGQ